MKLTNKKAFSCLLMTILLSFSLFHASVISNKSKYAKFSMKSSNKSIDNKFLTSVNNLKNHMVRSQGAYFKKVGLKFITKDNRFVVAEENIMVKLI